MTDAASTRHVRHVLLDGGLAGLADWYATPMAPRQVDVLLPVVEHAVQQRLRAGACCFEARLLGLICRWWQQREVQTTCEELRQTAASPHQLALLHLIYGQLLASRKLEPAMEWLASGFRYAAGLVTSAEYFRLLRRHEVLGRLTFGTSPAAAQDLPALLAESAVIERLQRGTRAGYTHGHLDTLG
jgi:hypothetical protein